MNEPTIKLLPSGYWHIRWSPELWIQLPKDSCLEDAHCFGWITNEMFNQAEKLLAAHPTEVD